MTLTELRYIVAVAQEKHFGRAAQRCFVSQPTLSIAIKKLEEELGLTLFDRSSNEVLTTEAGQRIVLQARRVLEEADRIRLMANQEQSELAGIFKLGLIFTIAPYLLPKLILSLRQLAPEMPLQLDENYTDVLTELLKRGALDAIVVAEPFHETGLATIPLYDEPFFVIVPKGHPFEQLDEVTPKQLGEERVLLLTEGNCMRDNVLDSCQELASRQKILGLSNSIQGSSINTIRHMVASGLGISVMPATALTENDHLLFSIIPFTNPAPKRRVVLASRRNFVRPKALRMIKSAILSSQLSGVQFIDDVD
ncbi:LysR family transcriptional regulator [Snodgrassella communis]|jgi:LysR family transcriptional regulator, hydrogen peroxide-inducible genes activator|uniref:LysR family transcriptional regulator n=2 Tax=Snodgrassella TaxID=1193515 RepID=A0A2N9WNY0_9NEIS|nr:MULTISPECIES: LysR substrate-binding domain-containing protein [Snodgrassella]KDN13932.1 transcriptional activator, hydrogen peroxide-inducible [Snodgrassella communis]PIT10170.1 LysR family transcriptional regulator [Snodgrassella communis]PIT10582.1 LysR family transcriptional regulator [Snodgrassella communis]PIT19378.1 LysR family transcriptional regulator [Snodgrassella communis]PIT22351.1 LysR family transcriptional regulator [Snodgrassella communis]